jgi:hypothetical protein
MMVVYENSKDKWQVSSIITVELNMFNLKGLTFSQLCMVLMKYDAPGRLGIFKVLKKIKVNFQNRFCSTFYKQSSDIA